MDSEESQKQLLKKMMEESFKQEDLYTAGNYWKFYEKKILDQIKKNKLKNFRSWEGGGGAGNRQHGAGGGAGGFRVSNSLSLPAPTMSPLSNPSGLTATVASFPIAVGGGGFTHDEDSDLDQFFALNFPYSIS